MTVKTTLADIPATWAIRLTAIVFICVVSSPTAGEETTHVPQPQDTPIRTNSVDLEERVLAWFLIGGSSNIANDRYVGWSLRRMGWSRFIFNHVRPLLQGGVRRIIIHNPFGHEPDRNTMAFDQAIHATESAQDWLTRGFVDAWKPVIEGSLTHGEPVEVICYLGRISGDPDFDNLLAPEQEPLFLARAWQSVELPLAAGMSIGVDSSSSLPLDHPGFTFIQQLHNQPIKVYIESRPDADKPHLHHWPVISVEDFWQRSDPQRYPDSIGMTRDARSHGEVILLYSHQQLTAEQARKQLANDYSVCGQLHRQIWSRIPLKTWFHSKPIAPRKPSP